MTFQDFDPFEDVLDAGGSNRPRYPLLMLKEQGQQWVGMVVDYNDKAPKYVKGPQGRKRDVSAVSGKEKTQDVLTVLLMPGTNCVMLEGEGDDAVVVPARPGTVVTYFISGHNRFMAKDAPRPAGVGPAWRNALEAKAKAGSPFRRGNVVKASFDLRTDIGAGGMRLTIPKHIIGFAVRDAKPEEAALSAQARAEFATIRQGRELVNAAPPAAPAGGGGAPLDDAF